MIRRPRRGDMSSQNLVKSFEKWDEISAAGIESGARILGRLVLVGGFFYAAFRFLFSGFVQ